MFSELPKDFEITKPVEEWSNALYVSEFKALGITWDLKRSNGKAHGDKDKPFYTYLRVAYEDDRKVHWGDKAHEHRWIGQPTFHIPTIPGTVNPETAAMFLGMMKKMWERGRKVGRAEAQAEFRKAIGLTQ